MLSFVVCLLVLGLAGISNGAAIDSASEDVSIDLMVPRGQTREEYLQSIVDYWTPERMASAEPMNPITVNEYDIPLFNDRQKTDGAEKILTPSAPLPGTRNRPATAGKVYFVMNGRNYLCSGSCVNAQNRDTVLTAGHCVYDATAKKWATNWIFVPQYSLGSRPFGTFTWRKMATKNGWMNGGQWDHDVGLVVMNTNDKGQHIQDVTGGLGITINAPRQGATHSFGYPMNINSGETMSTCSGTPSSPTYVAGFTGLQITCGMTGGCSGGPWVQQYNTNTFSGQQVSVNSFIITNRPNNLYGPYFTNDNIGTLYNEYQNQ